MWKYIEGVNTPEDDYAQFVHNVFVDGEWRSDSALILPLAKKLNAKSVLRAKFNLNPKVLTPVRYNWHVDILNVRPNTAMTSILYLNKNNGSTVFKDGGAVEPEANRLVLFDSAKEHAASEATDEARFVLNFNFEPNNWSDWL